jgi:hypothetical protein
VQGRLLGDEAEVAAQPAHQQQRRDLADGALHGEEADQLPVEPVQHRPDAGRLEGGPEVDRGGRRRGREVGHGAGQ